MSFRQRAHARREPALEDDGTINIELQSDPDQRLETNFQLELLGPDGERRVIPLQTAETTVGAPSGKTHHIGLPVTGMPARQSGRGSS